MYEGKIQIFSCHSIQYPPGSVQKAQLFETLFLITVIWSFQVRFSSINTPNSLIEVIRFISLSLINNDGSFNEIFSFS